MRNMNVQVERKRKQGDLLQKDKETSIKMLSTRNFLFFIPNWLKDTSASSITQKMDSPMFAQ